MRHEQSLRGIAGCTASTVPPPISADNDAMRKCSGMGFAICAEAMQA